MLLSISFVLLAVLLTGISQVLLKKGSRYCKAGSESFLTPYLNAHTIAGYGLLLFVTMISVIALQEVPLKLFYAITSLNFVVVAVLSQSVLGEEITGKMRTGILLIIGGVIIFNI